MGSKPQGEIIEQVVTDELGFERLVRVRRKKVIPKGFSAPRQICIRCLKTAIHTNNPACEKKICETCRTKEAILSLRALRKRVV